MYTKFNIKQLTINIVSWFLVAGCCSLFTVSGQGIALGKWRDHLPYNSCVAVTVAGSRVYCATPYCLFYYNKSDGSINNRLSNINGLSDFGVSTIRYSTKYGCLMIGYTDANIDIIDGSGNVTNFSDIELANILGNKTINKIRFNGNNAYLACSFGIVVFDMVNMEVSDTYYIGPNGNAINVYDIGFDSTYIYAGTEKGVYIASLAEENLTDFNNWKRLTLPDGTKSYNNVCYFNGKVYLNQTNAKFSSDTVFQLTNNIEGTEHVLSVQKFLPETGTIINNIETSNNRLIFSCGYNIDVFVQTQVSSIKNQDSLEMIEHIWTYGSSSPQPADVISDVDNTLWVADANAGLVMCTSNWSWESMYPNGPLTNYVWGMAYGGGKVWVATGGVQGNWNNMFLSYGVEMYDNTEWVTYNKNNGGIPINDSIADFICAGIDPLNTEQVYIGTWSKGLIMFQNEQFSTLYNETNSTLKPFSIEGYAQLRVGGIHFDGNDNMWVTNPGAINPISVKEPGVNGQWYSFPAPGITTDMFMSDFVIDSTGTKWIVLPRGQGLYVFNENGSFTNTANDQYKQLTNTPGMGNLPSSGVYSIAEDLQGEIWVGTDQGIAVFYTPGDIFTTTPSDAQQILIYMNLHWEYLLNTETVTTIAVDGANRKWIGTENSGVYLMSADGSQQLEHFYTGNSPIFSNTITSITINQQSGEVFIGTSNGIISYKGTATQGADTYSDKSSVYVYPNPVPQNYDGPVAIKGLVTNSDVKITNVAGGLVYETTAYGGQAVWNIRNFNGARVHSGVYLVFCSNNDGSETMVTKIVVIN